MIAIFDIFEVYVGMAYAVISYKYRFLFYDCFNLETYGNTFVIDNRMIINQTDISLFTVLYENILLSFPY